MSKHTPRPWTVKNHRQLSAGQKFAGAFEILEATENCHSANQRLIAAAPDLLMACKAALSVERQIGPYDSIVGPNKPLMEMLEDAIAKAEGK